MLDIKMANTEQVTPTATPNLSMTFFNFSSTAFSLATWEAYISAVGGELVQTPGDTLNANSGEQVLSEYQLLSGLASAGADLWTIWYDPNTTWRFGVKIHAPVQIIGIGKRPYWFVMYDQQPPTSAPTWISSGDDPSSPYTWPSELPFNIQATPQSTHDTLFITINVQDS